MHHAEHQAAPLPRRLAALAALAALVLGLAACQGNARPGAGSDYNAIPSGEASAELTNDLRSLREEEKLARDVYTTLGARYDVPIFSNIAGSEQTHMDRVGALLDAYGIEDPVVDDSPGAFTDPRFRGLYEELTTAGKASLGAALRAGATIEDLDIADIAALAGRTTLPDVQAVYDNLTCGSENHMRAFTGQLSTLGEAYEAQHITASQMEAILAAPHEPCGR
jgi:hypothetical protein